MAIDCAALRKAECVVTSFTRSPPRNTRRPSRMLSRYSRPVINIGISSGEAAVAGSSLRRLHGLGRRNLQRRKPLFRAAVDDDGLAPVDHLALADENRKKDRPLLNGGAHTGKPVA